MPDLELQSGFVVAVVLAAIFLADRLPDGALAQRALQVALAIGIVLTTAAFTEAVVPSPNLQDLSDEFQNLEQIEEPQDFFDVTQDIANEDDVRSMIQFAAGAAFVVGGLMMIRRYAVLPTAVIFGGLLVLLASGSQGGGDTLSQLLDFVIGDAASSAGYDWGRFAVFLLGTAALAWAGYIQFEDQTPRTRAGLSAPASPFVEPPAGPTPEAAPDQAPPTTPPPRDPFAG
ncbi:MAG: hypothetical protein WEB00_04875 [Dehalococcoidia bacterium]